MFIRMLKLLRSTKEAKSKSQKGNKGKALISSFLKENRSHQKNTNFVVSRPFAIRAVNCPFNENHCLRFSQEIMKDPFSESIFSWTFTSAVCNLGDIPM